MESEMTTDRPAGGNSRYREISRRAFLRRSAALGLSVAIPSSVLAACASDAEVFEEGTVASTTALSSTETTAQTTSTIVTAQTTSTTTTTPTTTEAQTPGATIPAGAELVVDFTYAAEGTSQGGVENPYVAVWIEDQAGELVATIALWFLQTRKGLKWLSDLRRWATVDGSSASIDALSSATRRPGEYSVVWDGTDTEGNLIPQGDYFIAIESAREHGPYSLIREQISIGTESFTRALEPEGELSDAAVSLILA